MRLLPTALAVLLLAAAGATHAAPTLDGVSLGEHACGPKITAKDLQGRVVVFDYWGVNCGPCKAAIPHLAGLQDKYDYGRLIVVANQCQNATAEQAAKAWKEHNGGAKVAVVNGGDLPGSNVSALPRIFVFNAAGKPVYDGKPGDGLDQAVADAVRTQAADAAAAKATARIEAVFGDAAASDDLRKLALQLLDTTRSSALAHQGLGRAALSKDPKTAEAAKAMLARFKEHVDGVASGLADKAKDSPSQAWAAMETLTKWVPQMEAGVQAQKQKTDWLRDSRFLKELAADKAWLALKAQGDKIDFAKNPKAKPTNQIEVDYKKMLKDPVFQGTQGLARAKAAAEGWKLDPETGRADKFKPKASKAGDGDAAGAKIGGEAESAPNP